MSSVVKGNAYGHGIDPFVQLAAECGLRHFSVFSADEAYIVHQNTRDRDITIMIMGMIPDEALEWVIDNGIEFFVFETDRLEKAMRAAEKVGKKAKIHLELETGMNRTGLNEPQLLEAIGKILPMKI